MFDIREDDQGLIFKVLVQPRSSKNEISGHHDDALKVRLTAPPVDGSANKMCIAYLAKRLGVAKSTLDIISGQSSRRKTVKVYLQKRDSRKDIERIRQFLMSFK
jgi:uncharacterized protein (TIGR00251 family)